MNDKPNTDDRTPQEAALEASREREQKTNHYADQAAMLTPSEFARMHRNQWEDTPQPEPQPEAGGVSSFDFEPQNIREVALCNAAGNIISELEAQLASQQRELDALHGVESERDAMLTAIVQWHIVTEDDDCSMDDAIEVCDVLIEFALRKAAGGGQ